MVESSGSLIDVPGSEFHSMVNSVVESRGVLINDLVVKFHSTLD